MKRICKEHNREECLPCFGGSMPTSQTSTPCTKPKLCGEFCTSKCQDKVTDIARGIAEQLIYVGLDRVKVQEAIAATLREYGEEQFHQGRLLGMKEAKDIVEGK